MSTLPKHILVPTDFSEAAKVAFDYALGVAEKLGARVTLLHSYDLPIVGFPDGALVATAEMSARLATASQLALDAALDEVKSRKIDITSRLLTGDARSVIVETATECGADLIVMGTHGRRGLAHALLGSVAEAVVRTSKVPVLTVRTPSKK